MARTVANGPPGLEVPHKINGQYGSIVMNVRSARPSRTHLTKIKGYYSLPDADDNREAHVGRRGENIYPGAPRGKTIVYEGELQSRTQEGLRILMASFKRAVQGRNAEVEMQIQDSEVPWRYNARVIDCEIDEEQANGPTMVWPWTRTFQLSLRLSDGRFYVDNAGAVYPSIEEGKSQVVKNDGTTDTDPGFTVQSKAGTDIYIKNNTLGTQLHLHGCPSGTVTVNFSTREILRGEEDASKYLVEADSNWWDEDQVGVIPGNNTLEVKGAEWGVSFFHAWE